MTPAARTQAAIDLLDAIVVAAADGGAAADTLIARYFAQRRYAGSKDRRAVRELVYAAVRLLGERPANGRAAMVALARTDPAVAATFDGSTHAPAPIAPDEQAAAIGAAPAWLVARLVPSHHVSLLWGSWTSASDPGHHYRPRNAAPTTFGPLRSKKAQLY